MLCLLLTQARLSSRVHGSVHGSSGQKAIQKFNIVRVRKKKKASSDEEKAGGGGKRAVPERAISTLPPRRGGAPTPVLSPARRSAAVRMGRVGTARPPEAEWSLGVAAFSGECYNQDIFKDPKKRHYHDVSVLYFKDIFSGESITCVSYDIPVWCTTFGFVCVFFRGVFLHSRVTGACPVTTDLIMRVNVRTPTTGTYVSIASENRLPGAPHATPKRLPRILLEEYILHVFVLIVPIPTRIRT